MDLSWTITLLHLHLVVVILYTRHKHLYGWIKQWCSFSVIFPISLVNFPFQFSEDLFNPSLNSSKPKKNQYLTYFALNRKFCFREWISLQIVRKIRFIRHKNTISNCKFCQRYLLPLHHKYNKYSLQIWNFVEDNWFIRRSH